MWSPLDRGTGLYPKPWVERGYLCTSIYATLYTWIMASSPAETRWLPSGLYATPHTWSLCLSNVVTHLRLPSSHTLTCSRLGR
jgi:hypothetical protein